MERKTRVGAVSFLNTKPLIFGFEQGMMQNNLDLIFDYPAKIAEKLINDEIDLGLIPVAAIPRLKESHIISDFCIGCDGEVGSVCIFSEVELDKIEIIITDHQSRTSNELMKLMVRDHWKISPEIQIGNADNRSMIKGTTAGLVIGDRALEQRSKSSHIYDLGLAWKEFTGLPFVFAAWVSNKPLDKIFIERFDEVNNEGLDHIPEIVETNPYPYFDLYKYYTDYIDYRMDGLKRKALEKFLALIG